MFERALEEYKRGNEEASENVKLYSYAYIKYLSTSGTPITIEELFKKYNFSDLWLSRINPMNKK
jgi:hypothetical protein